MKTFILTLLLALPSLSMAETYWTICGTKPQKMNTKVTATIPAGQSIAEHGGGSYVLSAITDENTCIITDSGRSTNLSCTVGKTVIVRQSTLIPALRIKLVSIDMLTGSAVIEVTKFIPEPKTAKVEVKAEAE